MDTSTLAPSARSAMRRLLLTLFVISGFSALIYQSIWTHYLGLMLGHAAYAQTLVLIIFMGGMALGSWGVSRRSLGLRRLLGAYALVEALIGLLGLAFHPVFQGLMQFNLNSALPALQDHGLAAAWQWLSAALLIAPQTVLLGATFPLIAAGSLRAFDDADSSRELGGLYFSNGIGAAAGALIATFLLLPALGMPGALAVAALLNLLLAACTAWMSHRLREQERPPLAPSHQAEAAQGGDLGRLRRALLLSTFLSSAASFGYEIGWVRLLNQALGTTLHAFELMLAAFIAGLALGGLWVRQRGPKISDLVRYAGWVQMAMGAAALISLPLLARSYGWVGWLVQALAPTAPGYVLYSLATAVIALVIMLPAAFFAGMTLPLFTAALLQRGAGERAVGQVYAANTVGAIAGVVLVVHLLNPNLGVTLSVALAALLDLAIGLALLRLLSPGRWTPALGLGAALALALFALVLAHGLPQPQQMATGAFRGRTELGKDQLLYFRDGSTASIAAYRTGNILSIATNGKPDASLKPFESEPSNDELTMLMLGTLPLAAHPAPKRVAVVGWGSGLSTHTLLGSSRPEVVDTIEIEPAMWEGARAFMSRNRRAYEDPRSRVRFEDARQFLATRPAPYDVLVSEPSNPWVSGVASLFTREFYALARRRLAPEGLLVQWLHSYQMTDALLAEIVAALIAEFPNSEVYQASGGDLVLLGHKGRLMPLNSHPWQQPELAKELERIGLGSVQDLGARRIGGAAVLRSFVRQHRAQVHSDFLPTVALRAPEHRFRHSAAQQLTQLLVSGLPLLQALDCRAPASPELTLRGLSAQDPVGSTQAIARLIASVLLDKGDSSQLLAHDPRLVLALDSLMAQRAGRAPVHGGPSSGHLQLLALSTLAHLDQATLARIWDSQLWLNEGWRPGPMLSLQLRFYEALAQRAWPLVAALGQRLLDEHGASLPSEVRQSTSMLRLLGAVATGAAPGPEQASGPWKEHDRFVRTWAAHEKVCAAR